MAHREAVPLCLCQKIHHPSDREQLSVNPRHLSAGLKEKKTGLVDKREMSAVPPSILHVVEMDQRLTGVGARGLTVALMGHLLKYGVTTEKLFPHRPEGSAGVSCYRSRQRVIPLHKT